MSFVREVAGIAVPESSTTASPDADTGDASSGSSSNAASGGGSGGPLLKLDPESLAALEEKGTEALVVAFVDEGDVDSIPGWRDATKGLQGQVCGVCACVPGRAFLSFFFCSCACRAFVCLCECVFTRCDGG